MAVAVKNSAETASGSVFDNLPVAVLAGILYVLGSIAIVFKAIPMLFSGTTAMGVTLQALVMLAVAVGLAIGGSRLVGPRPMRGLRPGIFVGFCFLLVDALLISWIGFGIENWFYNGSWFGDSLTTGVIVSCVIGVVVVYFSGWLFLRRGVQNFLGSLEDQGWFTATSHKRSQGIKVRRGTIVGILLLIGSGVFILIERSQLLPDGSWSISLPFSGKVEVKPETAADYLAVRKYQPEYHLDELALNSLVLYDGVPADIVAKLEPLKDQKLGDAEFESKVKGILRASSSEGGNAEQYWGRIRDRALLNPDPGPITNLVDHGHLIKDADPGPKQLGSKDWLLEIDRYTLREVNRQFRDQYEKIAEKEDKNKAPGEPADTSGGAGGSAFSVGEVGTPKDIEESRIDKNTPKPTTKKPTEATGTLVYDSLTLVPHTKYTLPLLIAAVGLWFAWRVVNVPTFADFLIATEAEMNKVSWTPRNRLLQDTIVVLITVMLTAVFLLLADAVWSSALRFVGVLRSAREDTAQIKEPPW